MRGKKSYNIRNVEAHLNSFKRVEQFSNNGILQTPTMNIQPSEQQLQNEYINAKFGVSKYASNLVSGKMFKNRF
jgi:hypothetical protein